jgi:mannosyltransferase
MTEQYTAAPPAAPPDVARRSRVAAHRVVLMLPPMVLTLAIAVVGIDDRSLWNDEYATWYASSLSIADLLPLMSHIDAVISPYYLFMHVWTGLFGDSLVSLRLPSLVCMALASGVITLIGRRLFDPVAGIGAGLLFGCLPAVSRYGEEARPYAFAIAAAALATLLLLRALDEPSWTRWACYGCCLTLVGLAHFVALTIMFAHGVVVWLALRTRSDFRLLRWSAAVAGTVTVVLPLAAKGSEESSAIDWIKADGRVLRQLPAAVFGSSVVAAIVVGAAAVSVAALWLSSDRRAMTVLVTWAVVPPVFCYLTFPVLHLFLHRYLLFTLPAWTLLAAAAPGNLLRSLRWRPPGWITLPGMLIIVGAVGYLGLPGQVAARRSPVNGEPDFRAAAVVVTAGLRPGDGIAYTGTFRNGRRAFSYEMRAVVPKPRDVFLARTSQELGSYGVAECRQPAICVGDTRRIWLITTNDASADPYTGAPAPIAALLRWEFARSEVRRLSHVRVFLLTRTQP